MGATATPQKHTARMRMNNIEMYTKRGCLFCLKAKFLLWRIKAPYTEIDVTNDSARFTEMVQRSQRKTVPQVFINDQHIGGSDDLSAARHDGRLTSLLSDTR